MKYLNGTDITLREFSIGTIHASATAIYAFKQPLDWPGTFADHVFTLPETVNIRGWCCNQMNVGGLLRSPRFVFLKRRGRKPPHLDEMATALLPWLEWADEQLATLKATMDNDATKYDARLKQSVTSRTRDDIVQRVYSSYYAEAKRRLNTEERIKALLKEAEDSARADIAFNWNEWWQNIDSADYVTLETGRVKLAGAELVAAVDVAVIDAVNSLKDGTFARPPSLSLRGG